MKPIEDWFGTFPIKDAESRLQKLVAQRTDLNSEINDLQFWIARYRARHPRVEERPEPLKLNLKNGTPPPSPNGAKPTFRSSIISTMASGSVGKQWNLNELRHELSSRGALTLDEKGNLKLMSMLSLMTKAKQLERVKTGVYRLPGGQEDRG